MLEIATNKTPLWLFAAKDHWRSIKCDDMTILLFFGLEDAGKRDIATVCCPNTIDRRKTQIVCLFARALSFPVISVCAVLARVCCSAFFFRSSAFYCIISTRSVLYMFAIPFHLCRVSEHMRWPPQQIKRPRRKHNISSKVCVPSVLLSVFVLLRCVVLAMPCRTFSGADRFSLRFSTIKHNQTTNEMVH